MFELKQKEGSDQYHFVLKAKNGQVILSSQVYASKSGAMNGIESVRKNASDDSKFERKTAKNGKFFFNLKAANSHPANAPPIPHPAFCAKVAAEKVNPVARLPDFHSE